jgi:RNA polymerase sigma-70 factor (ECF subfamily)
MKDPSVTDHPHDEERIGAEALFRAHASFVARFLHRLGAPAADIDDWVQEVFLIAHRKGGYVAGTGKPRTWLGAISLRVAMAGRRARSRRREDGDELALHALATSAHDPQQAFETRASLERVQRALDTLDLEHRATFMLYEIEGEACDSIAAAFAIPVGTVYSRLHHARRRFMDAYAELEAAPSPTPTPVPRTRLAGGT